MPEGRNRGVCCVAEWPICTGARRSPAGRRNAIWRRWPMWMNRALWKNLVQRLGQPKQWKGRRVRALRPFGDDRALLASVSRGEFTLNGFPNREVQKFFFPAAAKDPRQARRRSAWVSRQLRLLRAHGLIRKISGTHRYQLTDNGRKAIGAILAALRSTVRDLTPLAA